MESTAPSADELVLYIILPIISFVTIVMVVYYCYRNRKCCFSTKEEALLGNVEKKSRFTVDIGKRNRKDSSITSSMDDSFDSNYPPASRDYYQSSAKASNNNTQRERSPPSTVIAGNSVPRPDIRRSVVVEQAVVRDNNNTLHAGPYPPQRRATSPAPSLPSFIGQVKSPTDKPGTAESYFRHHSYDSAVSGRRISDNVAFTTISENDIQTNFVPAVPSPTRTHAPDDRLGRPPPSPRRLRHQGRVKGNEEEPSFSRPTNPARVSLIVSAVESLDLASSDDSDPELGPVSRPKQIYSPSGFGLQHKRRSWDALSPNQPGNRSPSSGGSSLRTPTDQQSGRTSPTQLSALCEGEDMFVPPRSPRSRSRSSPVNSGQSSLDMKALQAALNQHRKSEGDVLSRDRKYSGGDYLPDGPFQSETLRETTERLGGRRSGVSSLSNSSNSSLAVNKEPYPVPARQGRRRSSMQMPIDLNQIDPKMYEKLYQMPSVDSEDTDDDTPQIHFTLDYNLDIEVMTVKLIQARNLRTQAFSGTCDPYCTVSIQPGFNARQSKVHRRTTDPEFEERFMFGIKPSDLMSKTLEVRTFDYDQFSRDECTGIMEMKLDAIDFELNPHHDLWKKFRLEDIKSSELVETCGDLLLALSYLPSAEKLTVAIQKARNLKPPESRKGAPDPYVKVCLFRGNQRLKKKKTDTQHGTYNPVFNQALTFNVSPELMQCPVVRITCQVIHDHKLATNEELGHLEIGPNSQNEEELRHWKDVSGKHSNKPVARWHRLRPVLTGAADDAYGQYLNLADVRRSSSSVLFPAAKIGGGALVSRRSLT